jgi:hypothetical protein
MYVGLRRLVLILGIDAPSFRLRDGLCSTVPSLHVAKMYTTALARDPSHYQMVSPNFIDGNQDLFYHIEVHLGASYAISIGDLEGIWRSDAIPVLCGMVECIDPLTAKGIELHLLTAAIDFDRDLSSARAAVLKRWPPTAFPEPPGKPPEVVVVSSGDRRSSAPSEESGSEDESGSAEHETAAAEVRKKAAPPKAKTAREISGSGILSVLGEVRAAQRELVLRQREFESREIRIRLEEVDRGLHSRDWSGDLSLDLAARVLDGQLFEIYTGALSLESEDGPRNGADLLVALSRAERELARMIAVLDVGALTAQLHERLSYLRGRASTIGATAITSRLASIASELGGVKPSFESTTTLSVLESLRDRVSTEAEALERSQRDSWHVAAGVRLADLGQQLDAVVSSVGGITIPPVIVAQVARPLPVDLSALSSSLEFQARGLGELRRHAAVLELRAQGVTRADAQEIRTSLNDAARISLLLSCGVQSRVSMPNPEADSNLASVSPIPKRIPISRE